MDQRCPTGYGPRTRLLFDGDESKYELREVKFLGHMRLQKLDEVIAPAQDGAEEPEAGKNKDAYAEHVQCLDDKSLSLVIREAHNDGRKALKVPKVPLRHSRLQVDNSQIVVAVSSRALFDLSAEYEIYNTYGIDAYTSYQSKHVTEPCLTFARASMTGGRSPVDYLKAWNTALYLSPDEDYVKEALDNGIAAAVVKNQIITPPTEQLRIVFDGDAVLFSDDTERFFQAEETTFTEYEKEHENGPGPLKNFAVTLGRMQNILPSISSIDNPIRTYLLTSRDMYGAGKRALGTLTSWGLHINETIFISGDPKDVFLKNITPHLLFDDRKCFCGNYEGAGTSRLPLRRHSI
uniref:Cytosolic 5'-nucleotidase 1A-like n=1 Tax=Saccoglossus kowalevskii TaxID=10224 RepID=A0ABM0GLT4_SACKO|nr:PREDICTED: cytosolic 5'-nucleotidase 1A-like [Saccoglossus kowalevskii]